MINNTMHNGSHIEQVVMRRVRIIRMLRIFISGATLATLVFVFALWITSREVWVAKVFANGPQDLFGQAGYLLYAFGQTQVVVQALVVATLVSLAYLARAAARTLTEVLIPARV